MSQLLAAPPDVIRWSPRSQGHGDCAVSALELACGVTYETALVAAISVVPDVLTHGMRMKDIRKAAEFMGFKVRARRKYDLEEDTGILSLYQPHVEESGHVVYVWEGRIIEPMISRCQLWLSAPAFLSHFKYTPGILLEIEAQEGAIR